LYFTVRTKNDTVSAGQICLTFDVTSWEVGKRFTTMEMVDGKVITTIIKNDLASSIFDLPAKHTLTYWNTSVSE
jgi:hypothetical protein